MTHHVPHWPLAEIRFSLGEPPAEAPKKPWTWGEVAMGVILGLMIAGFAVGAILVGMRMPL